MTEDRSERGKVFPIVEAYGFPYDSTSAAATRAWDEKLCPFVKGPCEKIKQYKYGYCSVTYAAAWNNRQQHTYAVCDHRLDGPPVEWAIKDHFGDRQATLVPEVMVSREPRLNSDYVALAEDESMPDGINAIAIETQACDLRGGSVAPAWQAWEDGDVPNWRRYFTEWAERENRRDTVDYGVNTGNVYKRLGMQLAAKGKCLKEMGIPLYVIMQQSMLEQLRSRIDFVPTGEGAAWDITFAGFDFDGSLNPDGQLQVPLVEYDRTTLDSYIEALISSVGDSSRSDFLARAMKKAKKTNKTKKAGVSVGQLEMFPDS